MKKTIYILTIPVLFLFLNSYEHDKDKGSKESVWCIVNPSSGDWISVDPPTFTWSQYPDTPACMVVKCSYQPHLPPMPLPCPPGTPYLPNLFIAVRDSIYTLPNSVWLNIPLDTNCWYMNIVSNFFYGTMTGGVLERLPAALPPATLIIPLNEATGISTNVLLKWSPVDSAASYRVKIYNSRRLNNVVFDSTVIFDSIRVPTGRLNSFFTYYWRVKALKTGGEAPFSDPFSFTTAQGSLIKKIDNRIPSKFNLAQNYPNPFNPVTKIKFDIPANPEGANVKSEMSNARLIIYDILGREVVSLVNEKLSPGTYEVEWNAGNYPSGVYFYILESEKFKSTKRMVLIK